MSFLTFYRRFFRIYDLFHRNLLWLWLAACTGCFIGLASHLDDRAKLAICGLTIYPVMVGWLGLNGTCVIIKIAPRLIRAVRAGTIQSWALPTMALLFGAALIVAAISLVYMVISNLYSGM